jgi:outer membrane cobalamin receptor
MRIPAAARLSPSPVTVMDAASIARLTGTRLADALTREGGVYIKDYGAPGSLKTISQRGLGAEHTLLLLNGKRINSVQNGLFDVGLIPLDELERIEVVQGGQSASFGADAVAGVVNIVTRDPRAPAPAGITLSGGTAGYNRVHLSAGAGDGTLGVRGSFGQESGRGDYAYRFDDGTGEIELTRENADFRSRSGSLRAAATAGGGTDLSLEAQLLDAERGVPGPVVSATPRSAARQSDVVGNLLVSATHLAAPPLTIAGSAQFLYAYERYVDPLLVIGGNPVDDYFRNRDGRVELEVTWRGDAGDAIVGGISGGASWGEGSTLPGSVRRLQGAMFLQGMYAIPLAGGGLGTLRVLPAVRYDAVGDVTAWSPQAGVVAAFAAFDAGPLRALRPSLRVSMGRNFRAPTFNELYYSGAGGTGNPSLLPERSTGLEAGASADFTAGGTHTLGAGVYRIDMEDRIIWVPAGAGAVTPKNLRRVLSSGIDLSYRWESPAGRFAVDVRYLHGRTTKTEPEYPGDPTAGNVLPYVPQETVTAAFTWNEEVEAVVLRAVGATAGVQRTGFRYATEENTSYLPGTTVAHANLRAGFAAGDIMLHAKLEAENLFDIPYEAIRGYPMPLRTIRFTLAAGI